MDAQSIRKGVDVANGRTFPSEFRAEAVRLYRVGGRPYRSVAEELDALREFRLELSRRNGPLLFEHLSGAVHRASGEQVIPPRGEPSAVLLATSGRV